MKVLVGVKRVVDYAVKVRVSKGTIDLANFKQSMNPFCEVRGVTMSDGSNRPWPP
jgi:electron transfer flavoprotein beta subunit